MGPPRGEMEKVGSNVRGSCEDLSSDCFREYPCDVSDEALCVEYRCHLVKLRVVPVQEQFLHAVCLKTVELILSGSDFCDVIFVFH